MLFGNVVKATGCNTEVTFGIFTPNSGRGVEYSDEHVCLSVCLHIGTTRPNLTNFLCKYSAIMISGGMLAW